VKAAHFSSMLRLWLFQPYLISIKSLVGLRKAGLQLERQVPALLGEVLRGVEILPHWQSYAECRQNLRSRINLPLADTEVGENLSRVEKEASWSDSSGAMFFSSFSSSLVAFHLLGLSTLRVGFLNRFRRVSYLLDVGHGQTNWLTEVDMIAPWMLRVPRSGPRRARRQ
jgi:hypothetical protein